MSDWMVPTDSFDALDSLYDSENDVMTFLLMHSADRRKPSSKKEGSSGDSPTTTRSAISATPNAEVMTGGKVVEYESTVDPSLLSQRINPADAMRDRIRR